MEVNAGRSSDDNYMSGSSDECDKDTAVIEAEDSDARENPQETRKNVEEGDFVQVKFIHDEGKNTKCKKVYSADIRVSQST